MVNSEIKAKRVKVINEEKGVTEMSIKEALTMAQERGMDLINLTPNLEVPTVKIGDYSKYLYEKKKKEKENKKKQKAKTSDIKEIQLNCDIAQHDMSIKAKNIDRILLEGDKVNLVVKYNGRTVKTISNGPKILNSLLSYVKSKYKIERDIKIENNRVTMCISLSK